MKKETKKIQKTNKAPSTSNKKILYYGVGRRKTSVARARMYVGKGEILVNNIPLEKYFRTPTALQAITNPLKVSGTSESYDFTLKVVGGGMTGQLGASVLAISRCISQVNDDLKATLAKSGLLSRDPRSKERKKVNRIGARKKPQSSKR